ncbi:ribonuclease P protein component [Myxococcota bacterium]|nr:ribonuclease P protein component [Myxococcota bacterium]
MPPRGGGRPDQALPKSRRVLRSPEFEAMKRRGRRFRTAHFAVVYSPLPEAAESRLGLVVGRRTGNAVARNRVKRRIREFFRTRRPELARPWVWVVIAREGAAELTAHETAAELQGVLEHLQRAPVAGGSRKPGGKEEDEAAGPTPR